MYEQDVFPSHDPKPCYLYLSFFIRCYSIILMRAFCQIYFISFIDIAYLFIGKKQVLHFWLWRTGGTRSNRRLQWSLTIPFRLPWRNIRNSIAQILVLPINVSYTINYRARFLRNYRLLPSKCSINGLEFSSIIRTHKAFVGLILITC